MPKKPVHGGQTEAKAKYIAPTIIADTKLSDAVMQQEIFGPLLPIVTVSGHKEAISVINSMDKPLALYVFSNNKKQRNDFITQTSSGSLVFNAALIQVVPQSLPFGGVGGSGMGSYHGEFGIDTFSHKKPIIAKPMAPDTLQMLYPPIEGVSRKVLNQFFELD